MRAWQAWRIDPHRSAMLHHVAIVKGVFQNTTADDDLKPLAGQLDSQLWGLLPGFHRLTFEGGRVLLTLCVGDVGQVLRQLYFKADSICLNSPVLADANVLYATKAIVRLCRRGTQIHITTRLKSMHAALHQCGFVFTADEAQLEAEYNPAWPVKQTKPAVQPSTCVVIGAGLAGAAVANSLARRGWIVTVLDAASHPAGGASSLPAGLLVPHVSPDDNPLSRLSRCGVRITLQQAREHLRHGIDWGHTGVLQRCFDDDLRNLPAAWNQSPLQAASAWCYPAALRTLLAAGLPADSRALWHAQAGWLKPAALVKAWLAAPGIAWRGDQDIAKITFNAGSWQVQDAAGHVLAQADMVVVSAGYASRALMASAGVARPDLQALRGQITFGLQKASDHLPPFAVNGDGSLIPAITTSDGHMWLMAASYERDAVTPQIKALDHAGNLARLQRLLPDTATALADQFVAGSARAWAGVRCATPNHLPLVRPVATSGSGSRLWTCTGLGSRGLSFAALCGELLAAHLHREPLPVDRKTVIALMKTEF